MRSAHAHLLPLSFPEKRMRSAFAVDRYDDGNGRYRKRLGDEFNIINNIIKKFCHNINIHRNSETIEICCATEAVAVGLPYCCQAFGKPSILCFFFISSGTRRLENGTICERRFYTK